MKLKKYINKIETEQASSNLKAELKKDFGSLFTRPRQKLINYVKSNPYKSFFFMISMLLTNFALMFYLDTRQENPEASFKKIRGLFTNAPQNTWAERSTLSIREYEEIQRMKDSLSYYADFKGPLSTLDSVILTRLLRRYGTMDPTLFKNHK